MAGMNDACRLSAQAHAPAVLDEHCLRAALEALQAKVMICDRDLILVYVNPAAHEALRSIDAQLREEFGLGADELVGKPIHTFHRDPIHVEKILRDPRALPHRGAFAIGGLLLNTTSNSIYDENGELTGYVVSWDDMTTLDRAAMALEMSLRERDTLLKELHHRVKNNLQVIVSLLNLESKRCAPEVSSALERSALRVHAMAAVHERLYDGRSLACLGAAGYLGDLVRTLGAAHADSPARAAFREEADFQLGADLAIPMGLAVTELVSNAFKHAFAGRQEGAVTVTLARAEDGSAVVTVADDGLGFAPQAGQETGLGLRLLRQIVERQLNGSLTRLEAGKGAAWEVRFRVRGVANGK